MSLGVEYEKSIVKNFEGSKILCYLSATASWMLAENIKLLYSIIYISKDYSVIHTHIHIYTYLVLKQQQSPEYYFLVSPFWVTHLWRGGGRRRTTEIGRAPASNLLACSFAKNPGDGWCVINIIVGLWAALAYHSSFKQVIMKNMNHLDVNESHLNLCKRASNISAWRDRTNQSDGLDWKS